MKPLFEIGGTDKKPDTPKKPSKPKKPDIQESKKQTIRKKAVQNTDTSGWETVENFYKSLSYDTPYEFCVNVGDKRIARGYLSSYGGLCSDDPWIVSVMKQKNGFIYFRKLCSDLQSCPNNFPRCQDCKKYKK